MEATIMDCRLHYRYQPNQSAAGPVLLMLHGWGCDGSIFSFIEDGFREKASLLTVDFPGHGKSGEPPVPWGVGEYAEQVVQLLKQLAIPKVSIIAHSFGGRVAIYLSSKHPDLVEKLVITGGAGIKPPVSQRQSKRQKRYKRYQACLNLIKKLPLLKKPVEKWQAKLRRRYGSADYNRLSDGMRRTFVKVISEDLFPLLEKIQAPTLLIWGSEDTETPLWMGQQMEKAIPDAGLVVFEGRTHFAFVEEWQRFLVIVKAFFKEADGNE